MYGIQLFSVRDTTPHDMEGTLRALAEMGYTSVEFAGFFGHSAETVKGWLDKYGLVACGTHTGWGEIRDRYEETVAYHKAIGCGEIIVPGADLSTKEKLDEFIDFLNVYGKKLKDDGLHLSYHNHDGEFYVSGYGAVIHEEMQKRTTSDVGFEIDTYWVYRAGKDPVALMKTLADRVPVIHIKDGLADGQGKPLGMGTAPVKEIFATAKALGIPMVVESETLNPNGLAEAKLCIDYLKTLE